MASKKVLIKADVKVKELMSQHPRVSKKKTYFDLVERAKINQSLKEIEIQHPRVRKTVGSIKITDIAFSESNFEANYEEIPTDIIFEERPNFPSYLFDAKPTQIYEITDTDLIERIENELEILTLSITRKNINRLNVIVKKMFPKVITKKVPIEKSTLNRSNNLLPVEEFQQLQERYLREGIIPRSQTNIEGELKESENQLTRNYSGDKSRLYQTPQSAAPMQSWKMTQDLNSSTVSNDSSHSNESNERNINNKHRKSTLYFGNYSEERFKIEKNISDFSLQNISIFPAKK